MKLVVGLGNPGEKYQNNRHNVGFMWVDYLANRLSGEDFSWKTDKYTDSLMGRGEEYILAKPQTYMNKSGEAVKKLMDKFTVHSSQLVVVHDDLDIPFGDFKIQKVGPKLHNGLESIEHALKTADFLRVRIGVDARTPENRMDGERYVLSDFLVKEKEKLEELFPTIYERLVKTA